jgi:hypothetical protein
MATIPLGDAQAAGRKEVRTMSGDKDIIFCFHVNPTGRNLDIL